MTHAQFLRIKKLNGKAIIKVASRHNHREILAELGVTQDSHIDPRRTVLNSVLRGPDTAAGVASLAQALLDNAGVKKLRKDAVRALEIIFSLPPESTIDHQRYFEDSTQWAERYFQVPVVSAIIHLDEAAPHCHVLLLPLVHGRMIGSDLMGSRATLQAMLSDFHAQIGQGYGLARQVAQKPLSAEIRRQAIDSAFNTLEANSGLNTALLRVLLEAHVNNPEPLMLALGLEMPKAKVKGTFVGIMTKPCKPEKKHKPIGFSDNNPIGFVGIGPTEKHQTLCSVGFADSAPQISPDIEQQTDDAGVDYIRERDADASSDCWDGECGEFIKPAVKTSNKHQVVEAVRLALGG
jgi:hypothetical protein